MPLKHRQALWREEWCAAACEADVDALQTPLPADVAKTIEADICRTQPQWLSEEHQTTLRRVLRAYAASHPDVGYCQGMNNIAAVFILLGFDETLTLNGFSTLLQSCCPGYHDWDLGGFLLDVQVLDRLLPRV